MAVGALWMAEHHGPVVVAGAAEPARVADDAPDGRLVLQARDALHEVPRALFRLERPRLVVGESLLSIECVMFYCI